MKLHETWRNFGKLRSSEAPKPGTSRLGSSHRRGVSAAAQHRLAAERFAALMAELRSEGSSSWLRGMASDLAKNLGKPKMLMNEDE